MKDIKNQYITNTTLHIKLSHDILLSHFFTTIIKLSSNLLTKVTLHPSMSSRPHIRGYQTLC